MNIFDILQLIGGAILAVGYIPQIIKLIRTKSAKDFSITAYSLVLFGVALMELYGAYYFTQGESVMFFVTNTLSLVIMAIVFVLIAFYSIKDKHSKHKDKNRIVDGSLVRMYTNTLGKATVIPCKVDLESKEIIYFKDDTDRITHRILTEALDVNGETHPVLPFNDLGTTKTIKDAFWYKDKRYAERKEQNYETQRIS